VGAAFADKAGAITVINLPRCGWLTIASKPATAQK
jgi:hypothetical protein